MDEDVEDLVGKQRAGVATPLTRGEMLAEATAAVVFVALTVPLALSGASPTSWRWLPAAVLVVAYAVSRRVRFETGFGFTDGSLLVLVPMLFVLPPETVPPLCALGLFLGRLPDYVSGHVHWSIALSVPGNSLHTLGPAAVLAFGVDGGPRWGDWPLYLAAFAAYVVVDSAYALGREWIADRVRPSLQLRVLGEIYVLDALLAPVGLLAAFAAEAAGYAFLLAAPLLLLLRGEARERAARLDKALELSESRRALLETELAAARAREEVLATVSHGLQMPLATILGLSGLLSARGTQLAPERLEEIYAGLHHEAIELRQLVRQALDYVALRSGQPLRTAVETVDVAQVATTLGIELGNGAVVASADEARVRQVLLALEAHGRRSGAAAFSTEHDTDHVRVFLALPGAAPADPDQLFALPTGPIGENEAAGPGIDLVVARAVCRAMRGDLRAVPTADGWALVAELPARPAVSPAR